MDEAAGRTPIDAVPFRSGSTDLTTPDAARWRSSRRPPTAAVVVILFLACVAASVVASVVLRLAPEIEAGPGELPPASDSRQAVAPPLGFEEAGHPLGHPPAIASAAKPGYRVIAHQPDSATAVTWSPCRPIHYVVRPDKAPAGGERLIASAIARVAAATGLSFVNDGTTTEAPQEDRPAYQPSRYGERWAPVLITWATADEVPDFGIDVLGEAGPVRVRTPSGDDAFVSGTVALDAAKMGKAQARYGDDVARAAVLHELGHLLGLSHVNDKNQIMWPQLQPAVVDYQAGDLRGLAVLGSGSCQPDV